MSALRFSPPGRRQRSERRRGGFALVASLLVHALLLSLSLGGQGGGLPSLSFLWQDRRAEAPELQVVLAPPPLPAARPEPAPAPTPAAAPPAPATATPPAQDAPAATDDASPPPVGKTLAASDEGLPTPPPPVDTLPLLSATRPDEANWSVPPAPEIPPPVLSEAASSPTTARLQRREAVRLDAARADLAGLDAARQGLQQQAAQAEAARQQAALREEAARQEALKQEAARQAAAQEEAARRAAEQLAAQQLAAAQAAQREAARQEAARLAAEAARQAAAQAAAQATNQAVAQAAAQAAAEAEQREARLRAIGRQLNEEADRRDAERRSAEQRRDAERKTLPSSWSSARRARLFGRADSNQDLVLYAEALARRIQLDVTTFEQVREPAQQPHTDPLVTMAIRADGSVESVTFVRGSGVPALDEAIRRVIQAPAQARYPAFPPNLAREYDVIEIRRTWHIDSAIRLD